MFVLAFYPRPEGRGNKQHDFEGRGHQQHDLERRGNKQHDK